MPPISKNNRSAPQDRTLYRTLWRWHFYAGLFCIPFILILSITGAIYLFKPQIEGWNERAFQSLTLNSDRATPNEHIQSAMDAVPQAQFLNYRMPEHDHQAVAITLQSQAQNWRVYVHPSSNDVLQRVNIDQQLTQWVRTIHGELLMGSTGSVLVELAACWSIILLITGVYLWWPRSARGMAGVVYPRLSRNSRLLWRDMHAVVGFWIAALTLFLLVTALPWTQVWGNLFKEARQWSKPHVQQDWHQNAAQERRSWEQLAVDTVDLSPMVVHAAQTLSFKPPVELTLEDSDNNLWKVSSQTQNRPARADAWIDGTTGAIHRIETFADKNSLDKVIGIGIAAHEGQLFGWFNQLLGLVTALGLILLSVSGLILWRRRKPINQLGAPVLRDPRCARMVTVLVLVLGVLLPVVGLSLLILLFLEWSLLRRYQPLAIWLGLSPSPKTGVEQRPESNRDECIQ